jgi:hypothetical protein
VGSDPLAELREAITGEELLVIGEDSVGAEPRGIDACAVTEQESRSFLPRLPKTNELHANRPSSLGAASLGWDTNETKRSRAAHQHLRTSLQSRLGYQNRIKASRSEGTNSGDRY